MRQRRTLHDDNRVNSPGRYNSYNIHAPNIRTPKYMKQTLTELKGEKDSNTIIVGYFNIPLSVMDRTAKQKINKKTEDLTL